MEESDTDVEEGARVREWLLGALLAVLGAWPRLMSMHPRTWQHQSESGPLTSKPWISRAGIARDAREIRRISRCSGSGSTFAGAG